MSDFAERFRGTPGHHFERGFDVQLRPEKLDQPLRWKRPRRIFVNSMSDLFHDQVPDEYIAKVWAVMAASPQHTFQVLTKGHGRMRSLLSSLDFDLAVAEEWSKIGTTAGSLQPDHTPPYPLPNVWLGVSAEDQRWADIRIPALLDTPAAVRFVSAEPLLGSIDLNPSWLAPEAMICGRSPSWTTEDSAAMSAVLRAAVRKLDGTERTSAWIDWIIVGGESGRGARPMHPGWARSILRQCKRTGVPFLFKQWGEWAPSLGRVETQHLLWNDGSHRPIVHGEPLLPPGWVNVERVGKRLAGRELNGRTWDEYPAVTA